MENISRDLMFKKIRDRLNAEKIKLWLPPYTTENNEKGIFPEEIINSYSEDFKFSREDVAQILEELRLHSLAKLAEREKFMTEGLATLKIKLTRPLPSGPSGRKDFPVECSLSLSGSELKSLIASTREDLSPELLTLICKGRVLNKDTSLQEQGVKHGNDIMAMCMTASEAQLAQKEAEIASVERTRRAAELLSTTEDGDDHFDVQIANQEGNAINLPPEEKRALTLAMTLHEKGRAALKQKRVSHALLLLLEADSEFSKCSADILQAVDNYAILCLDIVWCYLKLKNLDQLPDAERRLKTSESCFKRCYGEKMERLTAIKGGTGAEQALFMRLYLLQGIVAFHKADLREAQNLFRRAEFVFTLLHVDEEKLNQVMVMGFSEKEARLGLRARNGNVQQAVDYIMEKRKEMEETNKRENKKWKQRVVGKKLGKTVNGEKVNVESYNQLTAMEFPKGASAEALRQCNNDINLAIEYLQAHPEIFYLPDPESKELKITDEMMQQIAALGFDERTARQALRLYGGNIQRAVEELIANRGFLPAMTSMASTSFGSDSSLTTSGSDTSQSSNGGNSENISIRKKEEREELNSLISDINTDTNDHLDLTLTDEREILYMYQGLASSMTAPNT